MKYLFSLVVLAGLLFFASCKNNEPTLEDHQHGISKKLQASVWKLGSVKRDGVDVTDEFAGFTLTIGDKVYTTTHGGLAWAASGTWDFQSQSTTQVIRDGDTPVDFVLSSNAKNLTLTFTISESTYTGGRTTSLAGHYEFNLVQ